VGRAPTSPERERAGLPSINGAGGTLDPLESRQGQVGGLLAVEAPQSEGDPLRHWYFYDGNGNVGQLLAYDATGPTVNAAPAAKYEYDPYGQLVNWTDTLANPFRFSTKWFDTTTGLGYWGYRYYSPRLGRWINRDPFEESGGLALYSYCENGQTNRVDPHGLWGSSMHYTATYEITKAAGLSDSCAEKLAGGNADVDNWTQLILEYHFDADVDGRVYPCGRQCHGARRYLDAVEMLRKSRTCPQVKAALYRFGQSLHSMQDGFSHQDSHNAGTPFHHAPRIYCTLWGDPFGIIHPRCIGERLSGNPNWNDSGIPDNGRIYKEDFEETYRFTESFVAGIAGHPMIRCCCPRSN